MILCVSCFYCVLCELLTYYISCDFHMIIWIKLGLTTWGVRLVGPLENALSLKMHIKALNVG